jgi:D-sedoheptulose 7-phosphate isomerase
MSDDLQIIETYLDQLAGIIQALPRQPLLEISAALQNARLKDRMVFIFGNGGSSATSSHMACDLSKNTRRSFRVGMKAISLADNTPAFSAYANDDGYDKVFSLPIETLGKAGDLAIAISGSGSSPNVVNGVKAARRQGMITIALTGMSGGELKDLVDICLIVPSDRIEQVEDLHLVIDHLITLMLCAN